MKPNLAQKSVPDKITLSDGKEYELAPLNLNMLAEVEAKFPDISPFKKIMDGKLSTVRFMLYLRLHDNYPELTEAETGKLVTWKVLTDVMKTGLRGQ